MKTIILLFGLSLAGFAQTASDSLNIQNFSFTDTTTAVTITASQGDGSSCTLTKEKGAVISLSFSCDSGDKKTSFKTGILRSTGTGLFTMPMGFGDVLCLLALNPTTAAVTAGSVGSVPANSVGWNCSTNIRTNGSVSGQTLAVSGSVTWP